MVATDGCIKGAAGAIITAVAYTNSFAGITATTLYDIDFTNGVLYKQYPPNAGGLVWIGETGVKATGAAGFDISPDNRNAIPVAANTNGAFAVLTTSSGTGIYLINLTTRAATNMRAIGINTVRDFAIAPGF